MIGFLDRLINGKKPDNEAQLRAMLQCVVGIVEAYAKAEEVDLDDFRLDVVIQPEGRIAATVGGREVIERAKMMIQQGQIK